MRLQSDAMILDLRPVSDFDKWHLPGSINMPLSSAKPDAPSLFFSPKLLEEQWRELESIFSSKGTPFSDILLVALKDRSVGLVCKDGDTARVATSVLRAKGLEASSISGGITKVQPMFHRARKLGLAQ